MTSENRDIVLNGNLCDQFVATPESWENKEDQSLGFDPTNVLWENKFEGDYQDTNALSDEVRAEIDALEGQEQANRFCRGVYDLNAISDLQEGYCCQSYAYYGHHYTFGLLSSATSLAPQEETFTAECWEEEVGNNPACPIQFGAELFNVPEPEETVEEDEEEASASLVASLVTITASALLLIQ